MRMLNIRQIESRKDTAAGPQGTQDRVFRSETVFPGGQKLRLCSQASGV